MPESLMRERILSRLPRISLARLASAWARRRFWAIWSMINASAALDDDPTTQEFQAFSGARSRQTRQLSTRVGSTRSKKRLAS
jgi:hypothetical protein